MASLPAASVASMWCVTRWCNALSRLTTSGFTPRPMATHECSPGSQPGACPSRRGSGPMARRPRRWPEAALEAAVRDLAEREAQPFPQTPPEVSLVLADDAMMADINSQWRNQPKPTNVLSFPAFPLVPGGQPGPMLGDIILARETIEREAVELGKPVGDHITHLVVHGFSSSFRLRSHRKQRCGKNGSDRDSHFGLAWPI